MLKQAMTQQILARVLTYSEGQKTTSWKTKNTEEQQSKRSSISSVTIADLVDDGISQFMFKAHKKPINIEIIELEKTDFVVF